MDMICLVISSLIILDIGYTDGCTTNFGKGPPCILPFFIDGELYYSCTTTQFRREGEGVVPRCPIRLVKGMEASKEESDWGECYTDCPLRNYKNNQELASQQADLVRELPRLVSRYSIGTSVLGQNLEVLRLTSGADRERKLLKPSVRLMANMHGNEVTGREILSHLAILLGKAYGKDKRITRIMDSIEVHILPSMNPDGWDRAKEGECGGQDYISGRLNENKVDLNRDFPFYGRDISRSQPETQAVARWITKEPWQIGANFHDGAVVASYPWDHYIDPDQKVGDHSTPDNLLFQEIAGTYAKKNPGMSNSSACLKYAWLGPITNGAAWYPKNGTVKDFGYREIGSLEFVMELSCCKFPPSYFLPREWDRNRESILSLLEWSLVGIKGIITDLKGLPVPGALVTFRSGPRAPRGRGISWAGANVTTTTRGEYWKVLLPGVYRVEAMIDTCRGSGAIRVVVKEGKEAVRKNIVLRNKFNCF